MHFLSKIAFALVNAFSEHVTVNIGKRLNLILYVLSFRFNIK